MPSKSRKSGPKRKTLRNIKLILEYDGSRYFGFQRQPDRPTVQKDLEEALTRFFDCKTKIRAASGRTDTGVHALHQVVNFQTSVQRDVRSIQRGLNALLPKQIVVREVEEMHSGFHARFDASSKVYEYRIWNHPVYSPLEAVRAFHVPYRLNLRKMKEGAKLLIGRHDFRSFCGANGLNRKIKDQDTIRRIFRLDVLAKGSLIRLRMEADGFLNHMVRNIVGTLIDLGRGRIGLAELKAILEKKDRRAAGQTVSSSGLTLVSVTY